MELELAQKELIIARILANCLRFQITSDDDKLVTLYFKKPTLENIYLAQELYQEYFLELEQENSIDEDMAIQYMLGEGLWTEENQKTLDEVTKHIDDFKVKLYESMYKSNEKKSLRKYLARAKEVQSELSSKRQLYFYFTSTGTAAMMRSKFLIGMSTYQKNGSPLFKTEEDFWNADIFSFDKIVEKYFKTRLTETIYREIARTEPWRSIWNSRKADGQLLGIGSANYSEEQRNLVIWSSIYDSIYEHPECPTDDVITDDDILDGWMIIQRRKRLDGMDKTAAEALVENEKIRNSGEVFIPVNTIDDAKKLDKALNDDNAKMIKRQRLAFARKQGVVQEAHMPDSMMEINQEINRMYIQNAKGK